MLLTALGVLVAGNVLAAVPRLPFTALLAGRAMQGVGLALLPLAMGIARDHLPADRARTATEAGADLPRLCAEIVVAALVGIVLARSAGALTALHGADEPDVVRLAAQLLGSLLPDDGSRPTSQPTTQPTT